MIDLKVNDLIFFEKRDENNLDKEIYVRDETPILFEKKSQLYGREDRIINVFRFENEKMIEVFHREIISEEIPRKFLKKWFFKINFLVNGAPATFKFFINTCHECVYSQIPKNLPNGKIHIWMTEEDRLKDGFHGDFVITDSSNEFLNEKDGAFNYVINGFKCWDNYPLKPIHFSDLHPFDIKLNMKTLEITNIEIHNFD